MSDDRGLVDRARIKSAMLRMGEPIAFGSDADVIDELCAAIERLLAAEAQRDKLKEALDRLSMDAAQIMSAHDPRGAEINMDGNEANARVHSFVADAAPFIEEIPSRARQALQDSKT